MATARTTANPRDTWPAWTATTRYTLTADGPAPDADDGPSPDDARWAAEHLNDGAGWHDPTGPEADPDADDDDDGPSDADIDRMYAAQLDQWGGRELPEAVEIMGHRAYAHDGHEGW